MVRVNFVLSTSSVPNDTHVLISITLSTTGHLLVHRVLVRGFGLDTVRCSAADIGL